MRNEGRPRSNNSWRVFFNIFVPVFGIKIRFAVIVKSFAFRGLGKVRELGKACLEICEKFQWILAAPVVAIEHVRHFSQAAEVRKEMM
jgi:hypothetical protein